MLPTKCLTCGDETYEPLCSYCKYTRWELPRKMKLNIVHDLKPNILVNHINHQTHQYKQHDYK